MRLVMVLLLALSTSAIAAEGDPLRLGDFAYGMTLQGEANGAFYGLELPQEVYRHVSRADLGDLRIFNAQGEVVPHLLQQPPAPQEQYQRSALPLFPLYGEATLRSSETTLRIVPDAQGALIDLRARSGEEMGRQVTHYLLDASALRDPLRTLRLRWQAGSETFIAPVTVEASDDLSHWRSVGSGSLADLLYEGYQLQRNEITLASVSAKYLRINWPFGARQVVLSGVEAEVAQAGSEAVLRWSSAEALPGDGSAGRFRFAAGGFYPVERVEIGLPQQNSVATLRLSSSDDEVAKQWRHHYQGAIYSLQQGEERLHSEPIATGHTTHRYWQLDVEQRHGGLGGGQPQLKLGWRPQRLIFVARGSGPFTLAFGSARAEVALPDSSLQGVLDSVQARHAGQTLVTPVVAQAMRTLGGEQQLQPAPPPVPWKTWLLWGILLLGVVLMVMMARNLYREMNRT